MNLKQYLKESKITQAEFSKFLGISKGYLGGIVRGVRLPGKRLSEDISTATLNKVSFEELYKDVCPCCGRRLHKKTKKTQK